MLFLPACGLKKKKKKKFLWSPFISADGLKSSEPQSTHVAASLRVAEGGKKLCLQWPRFSGELEAPRKSGWNITAPVSWLDAVQSWLYCKWRVGGDGDHSSFLEEMRECNFSEGTNKIRQPSLKPVSWMLLTASLSLITRQQLLE